MQLFEQQAFGQFFADELHFYMNMPSIY